MRKSTRSFGTRSYLSDASLEEPESGDDQFLGTEKCHKKCLLDVILATLTEADFRMGDRLSAFLDESALLSDDIKVGSFIVRLKKKALLEQTLALKLQIERNLDKAFSHKVPDLSVKGLISKIHAIVDSKQYTMIRGMLAYNFGENLDDLDFQVTFYENCSGKTDPKPWLKVTYK